MDEEEADEEEVDEEGDRNGDNPRGATLEMVRVRGGAALPQRKTWTYRTSHLNVHTCC